MYIITKRIDIEEAANIIMNRAKNHKRKFSLRTEFAQMNITFQYDNMEDGSMCSVGCFCNGIYEVRISKPLQQDDMLTKALVIKALCNVMLDAVCYADGSISMECSDPLAYVAIEAIIGPVEPLKYAISMINRTTASKIKHIVNNKDYRNELIKVTGQIEDSIYYIKKMIEKYSFANSRIWYNPFNGIRLGKLTKFYRIFLGAEVYNDTLLRASLKEIEKNQELKKLIEEDFDNYTGTPWMCINHIVDTVAIQL